MAVEKVAAEAAKNTPAQSPQQPPAPSVSRDRLQELKNEITQTSPVRILPVMIPSGAYAEYGEIRSRARRAVLEALGTLGWIPKNAEHIGYISVPLKTTPSLLTGDGKPPAALKPEARVLLPYEWLEPSGYRHIAPRAGLSAKGLLVLWIPEDRLLPEPIKQLNHLMDLVGRQVGQTTTIIGPRTSTTLRQMLREVRDSPGLRMDFRFLSATPTVAPAMLQSEKDSKGAALPASFAGLNRMTATDDQVCAAIIKELDIRGVKLRGENENDVVAIISEWETYYGRALPRTFAHAVSGRFPASNDYPESILPFSYLRGIDGMLPGTAVASPVRPENEKSSTSPGRRRKG